MALGHFKLALIAVAALALAGCSHRQEASTDSGWHHGFSSAATDPFAGKGSPLYQGGDIPFGGGKYHVGSPYQVAGRWYTPSEQPRYDKIGTASWYGEDFHRRKTANGEWFDMNTLTAAHPTLPLPSYVVVTNLDNNRNVIVRVNDRGPFVADRVIDLSKRAADVLGYRGKGKTRVRVRMLGPAPHDDSMAHVIAMNNAMNAGASKSQLVAMADNVSAREDGPMLAETQEVAPATLPVRGNYIVRVGVFHDLGLAQEAQQQMASLGPTHVVPAVGARGPMWRVEIGPVPNAAQAQSAMASAQSRGFEGARLVQDGANQVSLR